MCVCVCVCVCVLIDGYLPKGFQGPWYSPPSNAGFKND